MKVTDLPGGCYLRFWISKILLQEFLLVNERKGIKMGVLTFCDHIHLPCEVWDFLDDACEGMWRRPLAEDSVLDIHVCI